jgi:hypothetical protein
MFGYIHVIRTLHTNLRYFDWDRQVHFAKGKPGEQQGDPLEMLVFNLTTLHLWRLTFDHSPGHLVMLTMDTTDTLKPSGFVHGREHPAILQTGKSCGPVVGVKDPTKIFLFFFKSDFS